MILHFAIFNYINDWPFQEVESAVLDELLNQVLKPVNLLRNVKVIDHAQSSPASQKRHNGSSSSGKHRTRSRSPSPAKAEEKKGISISLNVSENKKVGVSVTQNWAEWFRSSVLGCIEVLYFVCFSVSYICWFSQ